MPLSTLVPRKQRLVNSSGATFSRVSRGIEFFDREGFAGERSLDDEQILGRQNAHVGGNHVAGGKFDEITGDEALQGNLGGFAIAHHGGGDLDHGLELGGGGISLGFLDETQADAEDDHGHHDPAAEIVAGFLRGGKADDGQDGEENDERVAHGVIEARGPIVTLLGGNFIGANGSEPRFGFGLGQPFRTGGERAQGVGAFGAVNSTNFWETRPLAGLRLGGGAGALVWELIL